ncbi:DUF1127 domain-containing protein [Kushneria aurantia]|uniref:DUF1127 domain-containing protein n=1 Tax=Kushneria aurantia TaxID=504092 RepID=A0ABV6G0L5_9GAMM|nr:DUF1127 domain-containing protein [Kushneria aurantia]
MNLAVQGFLNRLQLARQSDQHPRNRAATEQTPSSPSPSRWQRWHSRRQLARLSDAQLWDIGVSREEALEEARKPFWR